MESLWGDWPRDRILEFHAYDYTLRKERNNNIESFLFKNNIVENCLFKKKLQKINTFAKRPSIGNRESLLSKLRKTVVLLEDLIPIRFTREQLQRLDAFKPSVIYTLGASVSVLSATLSLSKKYNIPIVIHFMDNWVEEIQWTDVLFSKTYHKLLLKELMKCIKRSSVGLAISPEMAEAYRNKFHIPFYYLMNCVSIKKEFNHQTTIGNQLKFVYAGGLHMERWKALLDISKTIQKILPGSKMIIYTTKTYSEQYGKMFPLNTFFHEEVDHNKIFNVYEKADILVHAETSNKKLHTFFKYSISTKIPEYLASGKPILFYGPQESGVYQYLKKYNASFLASTPNELPQTIKMILSDSVRNEIIDNECRLSNEMHNIQIVRETLRKSINEVI